MLSRVADSLYWMSRYLERAEHATRLLDVNLNLMLDESATSADRRWLRVLQALGNPKDVEWKGDPYALMTQYPPGQPAYSPRLLAPKPPILNIVTTPTTAMNRAGSGLKNDALDHRMEFYDPKTRPVALFWDAEALLTTPPELVRSTATTAFS